MAIGGYQNSALPGLGEVLMQGTRDYRDIRLKDDDEQRRRAERLADTQSARDYQDKRFEVERKARLDDHDVGMQRMMVQTLVQHGYLNPGQIHDSAALNAAFARAQHDGLIDRYKDMISSGFLKPEDIDNPAAVAAAEAELGKRGQQMLRDTDTNKANAAGEATRLRDENVSIQNQIKQLEQKLGQPPRQPSPQEVQQRAMQIAAQTTGKPPMQLSREDIAQAAQQAEKELTSLYQQQDYMEQRDAQQQMQALRSQLQYNVSYLNNLSDRFKVAPAPAAPAPSAPPTAAAPAAQTVTPEQRAAAIQAAIAAASGNRGQPAVGAAPTEFQPLPGGEAIPEVAAQNAARAARFQMGQADPVQQAQKEVDTINSQIAALRAEPQRKTNPSAFGTGPVFSDDFGGGVTNQQLDSDQTANKAVVLSNLYQKLQVAKKNQADLAARMRMAPAMAPMSPTRSLPVAVSNSVYSTGPDSPMKQAGMTQYSPFELAPGY